MPLTDKTCVPCRGGVPPLTLAEAEGLRAEVPDWALTNEGTRIERDFTFDDFAAAIAFVNKVGLIAEAQGHHPDITFGWGYAHVVFFTHKIKGLHGNDFVMAAKVDDVV